MAAFKVAKYSSLLRCDTVLLGNSFPVPQCHFPDGFNLQKLGKAHHLMLPMLQKLRQHGQQVDFTTVAGVDHFNIVENLQLEDFVLTKAIVGLVTDVSESLPAE